MMAKSIEDIEAELDELQQFYIDEDDELMLQGIELKFDRLLAEATELDGVLRIARGVTILNWTSAGPL